MRGTFNAKQSISYSWNLAGNVERITFPGLVSGRASGERRALLPQSFSKLEVYVCEGKRQSIAEEAECDTGNETQVR